MNLPDSAYFDCISIKIHTLPRCVNVWVIIQIARHFLCSICFWCGFICQGVFFLTLQFCEAVDVRLILLNTKFRLQYFMNYSSDFNNYCRFWLHFPVVCTTLLYWLEDQNFWAQFLLPFFLKYKQCLKIFMKT